MSGTKVNRNRFDPYRNFKFRVKFEGKNVAGASKIVPNATAEELDLAGPELAIVKRLMTRRSKSAPGATALFAGAKGTGKSRAAEVIASQTGKELYRIDLSKVVSKYVGETEKNLARIFASAEDAGAVLLFEEAQALFGKRSSVRDSHDRYANIEISYLLQRLESYPGVAILATNRKKDIDEAFLRRLRHIVEFPSPK